MSGSWIDWIRKLCERKSDENMGEPKSKTEFLKDRLRYHIEDYKKKRDYNRSAAAFIKSSTIILGGVTTAILGLKGYNFLPGFDNQATAFALIFSAVSTMITAWEAFADHTWKWIRYRSMLARLYEIRDQFHFGIVENPLLPPDKTQEFFDQLEAALREVNEAWVNKHTKADDKPRGS
jgi:hypothetical protein